MIYHLYVLDAVGSIKKKKKNELTTLVNNVKQKKWRSILIRKPEFRSFFNDFDFRALGCWFFVFRSIFILIDLYIRKNCVFIT